MDEADGPGVEGDAAVRVGARRSVLEVALDGAADVGQLAADLVVTAGEEFHLDQVIALRTLEIRVLELRFLGLAAGPLGRRADSGEGLPQQRAQ